MDATEASWVGLLERAREMGPDPDLTELSDAQVESEVREGASRIAALTCAWLLHVAELVIRGTWADDGARTPGQWLSWACGTSPRTAREYVRVGLALRNAPLIRARFAVGTLSYAKVRAITRVVAPEIEQSLLQLADSAPAAQLERIIAGCRQQLNAQERWARGAEMEPVEVRNFRRVEIDPDTVEFRIRMPVADAEAFGQRVDRQVELADRAAKADREAASQPTLDDEAGPDTPDGGVTAGSAEPPTQPRQPLGVRRAIAVSDALASAVADGPPDRSGVDDHLVVVHVDVDDLVAAATDDADGASAGEAESDLAEDVMGGSAEPGGAAEPARRARPASASVRRRGRRHVVTGRGRGMSVPTSVLARLSCDADLRVAGIDDPDGGGRRHPADIGRRSRVVPAPLRRALQLRDRHCRFPGCHATRHLHAHHVIHWARGGPTDLDNLLLLCAHHHRFVHDHHWTLREVDAAAGRWTFHPPDADEPHPAALRLPEVSAEPVAEAPGGCAPDPRSLQPPWWDGDYDLDETIRVVAQYVTDLTPPPGGPERYEGMVAVAA